MKKFYSAAIISLFLYSCNDLDLVPLSKGTNESWYSSKKEIAMAVNNLYSPAFWTLIGDSWSDNEATRNTNTSFVNGTFDGQDGSTETVWSNRYRAIARANTILEHLNDVQEDIMSSSEKENLRAEALFVRASCYATLVTLYGDVPLVTTSIDIDEAFNIGRTAKDEIVQQIYNDYNEAIAILPISTGQVQRATKGAALALKARFALYNQDWQIAADAAKECMSLDCYKLYPSFKDLFLPGIHNTTESIFALPRSIADNVSMYMIEYMPRNQGGWASATPTWDLLASFICTDGLPIDESPLFDPHDPFKNRDPRCNETIVPFNSEFLGFTYAPHPDSLEVLNHLTGLKQINNDTKAVTQHASYNGLLWKKGMDESCLLNGNKIDPDNIIIRYADVLLIYAEAKIELNQIDESVLNAINQVRARAYGVSVDQTSQYPAVTELSQQKLRSILRMERRMEFAKEGTRYFDLIRWKIAEKVLKMKNYGILYPVDLLIDKVTSKGHWFWASAPDIDENGIADFSKMEKTGLINPLSQRAFSERQYLWPIPTKEILINKNITQNPGY